MGRVFQREGKKGSTWYVEYYVQGIQKRERVGRKQDGITERIAKEALKSRMGDISQGKFDLAQTKQYPLFSKAIAEYIEFHCIDGLPAGFLYICNAGKIIRHAASLHRPAYVRLIEDVSRDHLLRFSQVS